MIMTSRITNSVLNNRPTLLLETLSTIVWIYRACQSADNDKAVGQVIQSGWKPVIECVALHEMNSSNASRVLAEELSARFSNWVGTLTRGYDVSPP